MRGWAGWRWSTCVHSQPGIAQQSQARQTPQLKLSPRSPAVYVSPRMGFSTTPTTGSLPIVRPTDTQEKG